MPVGLPDRPGSRIACLTNSVAPERFASKTWFSVDSTADIAVVARVRAER